MCLLHRLTYYLSNFLQRIFNCWHCHLNSWFRDICFLLCCPACHFLLNNVSDLSHIKKGQKSINLEGMCSFPIGTFWSLLWLLLARGRAQPSESLSNWRSGMVSANVPSRILLLVGVFLYVFLAGCVSFHTNHRSASAGIFKQENVKIVVIFYEIDGSRQRE